MNFDVVVVGGGHAGCEAAAAAARIGAKVAIVTRHASDLGQMSCNPAIGGLGKAQLVREIDALDGLMGRAADQAAIQFRLLNRSKGPAVQGPRVQADRMRYAAAIHTMISAAPVTIVEAEADDILVSANSVIGVRTTDGRALRSPSVVVTTGTFIGGILHMGDVRTPGGRFGEASTRGLLGALQRLGLRVSRLKTGTPPRLDGCSIDWSQLDLQTGDANPHFLSDLTTSVSLPQVACAITRTVSATHDIVRNNLARSPVYNGAIVGTGPRYCPSIEDKILRFGDRDGHQIFLEPEGLDTLMVYPNGISTALPLDAQTELVRSIPGLDRANIVRAGYAVEYSYCDPTQLEPTLEVSMVRGLFLAGQINGTTGYEEAAAQGIVAGINAARAAAGSPSVTLDRADAYIGVLIDDLVTRGVSEPYRMFTSRAEFRLALRTDNAAERLGAKGVAWGCVGSVRARQNERRADERKWARASLSQMTATPSQVGQNGLPTPNDGKTRTAFGWLGLPGFDWARAVSVWPELGSVESWLSDALSIEARYQPYLSRQETAIRTMRNNEHLLLASTLDFGDVAGLSTEAKLALETARPATLGDAARLTGVTAGGLTALLAHVRTGS